MIMTAATAKTVVVVAAAAVKAVMTVNLILLHMDLNAVIRPGMNLVLIVLLWNLNITGIVLVVNAPVMMVVVAAAVATAKPVL